MASPVRKQQGSSIAEVLGRLDEARAELARAEVADAEAERAEAAELDGADAAGRTRVEELEEAQRFGEAAAALRTHEETIAVRLAANTMRGRRLANGRAELQKRVKALEKDLVEASAQVTREIVEDGYNAARLALRKALEDTEEATRRRWSGIHLTGVPAPPYPADLEALAMAVVTAGRQDGAPPWTRTDYDLSTLKSTRALRLQMVDQASDPEARAQARRKTAYPSPSMIADSEKLLAAQKAVWVAEVEGWGLGPLLARRGGK